MKTVYGYIRVSTPKQGKGVSLEAQRDAIQTYASKHNLLVKQWFEERETAAKQGRPLFNAMMRGLLQKDADGLIIHKIDRSARNLQDWLDIVKLNDIGAEVHFVQEGLDIKEPSDRLSADIQAVIAANYIRNLRQETIKGLYGRLKQGIYPLKAPPGYLNNGSGRLKTVDPIQGPLVKKAFELYATKQFTLSSLSLKMKTLGLKNSNQNIMRKNSLSYMLNNPFYMGIIKFNGQVFNGRHEPLISPDLFQSVQYVLRGKTNQKVIRNEFIFSKRIKCGLCGFSLIGERQKGYVYYRCHTPNCVTKGFRESFIDNQIRKIFFWSQLLPEETSTLLQLLDENRGNWLTKWKDLLDGLKLQINLLTDKLERLTDCYVEGGLNKEAFEKRKRSVLIEIKKKEAAYRDLEQDKEQPLDQVAIYLELGSTLIKSYQLSNLNEKRNLLERATSNLTVTGKNLEIAMRSPFFELQSRRKVQFCCLNRATPRTKGRRCAQENISAGNHKSTQNIAAEEECKCHENIKPMSRKALKEFFNLLVDLYDKDGKMRKVIEGGMEYVLAQYAKAA